MWSLFKKEARPFNLTMRGGISQLDNYRIIQHPYNGYSNCYLIDTTLQDTVFQEAELTFYDGRLGEVIAAREVDPYDVESLFESIRKKFNSIYKYVDSPLCSLVKADAGLGALGALGFGAMSLLNKKLETNRYWESADSVQIKLSKIKDLHSLTNIRTYLIIEYSTVN